MRRAMGIAMAFIVLMPAGTAAQAPADTWPTPRELKEQFQDIGWQFAASTGGDGWTGYAPTWNGDGGTGFVLISLATPLAASTYVEPDDVRASISWPEDLRSGWTATVELLSRVPVGSDVIEELLRNLVTGDRECHEYLLLDGGTLTIQPGGDGWDVRVEQEPVLSWCDLLG